jgi:hypothetical protein
MSDTPLPVSIPEESPIDCLLDEAFLEESLDALLRGEVKDLDAYLTLTNKELKVDGLEVNVHCHALACTQNGARTRDLAKMLGARIIDYVIPRTEWQEAKAKDTLQNTDRHSGELRNKAKGLFTDLAKSGEGGEMLLYMLLQTYLSLPQLICKMNLKTSGAMHVHGVDGVHVDIDRKTGQLLLYWGESKLYKSPADALRESLKGLKKYLTDAGGSGSPLERDLFLLRDNLDLNNESLEQAILYLLDPDNKAHNDIRYRGAALVGFNAAGYPSKPNEFSAAQVEAAIKAAFPGWLDLVRTALGTQHILKSYHLEIFLIPFPSVAEFRKAFRQEVK